MTNSNNNKRRSKALPGFEMHELEHMMFNGGHGFCRACGAESEGLVEPDAENYECGTCGEYQVYGLEQLLLMGEIA